jgi:Peptidase family M48
MRVSPTGPVFKPAGRPLRIDPKDGSSQVSPAAFRDSYLGQIAQQVPESRLAAINLEELRKQSLSSAFETASSLLGPVSAVALAGDAMLNLTSSQETLNLDTGMLRNAQAERIGQVEGTQTPLYLGMDDATGLGFSTSRSVVLPQGFEPLLGHPVGAFVIGHELGHVESSDVIKKFGRRFLVESLAGSAWVTQAQEARVHLEREMEHAADQRGFRYSREQGFTAEQTYSGIERFLTFTDAEASDSHPSRAARLERIREAVVN